MCIRDRPKSYRLSGERPSGYHSLLLRRKMSIVSPSPGRLSPGRKTPPRVSAPSPGLRLLIVSRFKWGRGPYRGHSVIPCAGNTIWLQYSFIKELLEDSTSACREPVSYTHLSIGASSLTSQPTIFAFLQTSVTALRSSSKLTPPGSGVPVPGKTEVSSTCLLYTSAPDEKAVQAVEHSLNGFMAEQQKLYPACKLRFACGLCRTGTQLSLIHI